MQKIKEAIEKRIEVIIKVLLAIILFLVCIFIFFISKSRSQEEDISENQLIEELFSDQRLEEKFEEEIVLITEEQIDQRIFIDVKGAVEAPGVYQMGANSRVIDCIEKAGGFLIDAEQKRVNLAQRAEDQMVIYIPMKGEDLSEFEQLLPDKPVTQSTTDMSKVDLNKATKEELKSLIGIGDVKAESIIAYREENGSFEKIEDIKNISGIGEATFEKLRESIQVAP